ncbi:aminoacyl-tRNA hydrolase [Candidatus Gracilibacteria bacterium]|nr:aminoacyl-tRNA hydrolase [Candidatus Gracilibacteria bacterium]
MLSSILGTNKTTNKNPPIIPFIKGDEQNLTNSKMKLIVGLGNPGKKYESTRHNAGFIFLDVFKQKHNFGDFIFESKFKAEVSTGRFNGEKALLIKPQTFMNLSGEALQKVASFYKIDLEDWVVIYDDKDMDFGKIRFRETGSAGGHNGIKSLIQYFGKDFKRIKIGIGYDSNYEVSDWVLGKFSEEQLIDLDNEVYDKAENILEEKI